MNKYDPECIKLITQIKAEVVILVVVNGTLGSGFSITIDDRKIDSSKAIGEIPELLREIATRMDGSITSIPGNTLS